MKKYILEAAFRADLTSLTTRAEKMKACQDALQMFKDMVDEFAQEHPGKITIGEGLWLNNTLEIHADPAIIAELSKLPGIAKIEEPKKIDPEKDCRLKPPRPPRGPRL